MLKEKLALAKSKVMRKPQTDLWNNILKINLIQDWNKRLKNVWDLKILKVIDRWFVKKLPNSGFETFKDEAWRLIIEFRLGATPHVQENKVCKIHRKKPAKQS